MKAALSVMRAKQPEQHREVIKLLKRKDGDKRQSHQLSSALEFLEEFARETTMVRSKGVLLVNQRQHIAHRRFKDGFTRKQAAALWNTDFADKTVYREKDRDGQWLLAVRQIQEISQEDILRAKQVFRGETLMMGQEAARSMLTGDGPQLNKHALRKMGVGNVFSSANNMLAERDSDEEEEDSDDEEDEDVDEEDASVEYAPEPTRTRKSNKQAPAPRAVAVVAPNAAARSTPLKKKKKGEDKDAGSGSRSSKAAHPDTASSTIDFANGIKDPIQFVNAKKAMESDVQSKIDGFVVASPYFVFMCWFTKQMLWGSLSFIFVWWLRPMHGKGITWWMESLLMKCCLLGWEF